MSGHNESSSVQTEFESLLRTLLDRGLSADDEQRLDVLLNLHPQLRERYVEQIWTDTLLKWSLTRNTLSCETPQAEMAAEFEDADDHADRSCALPHSTAFQLDAAADRTGNNTLKINDAERAGIKRYWHDRFSRLTLLPAVLLVLAGVVFWQYGNRPAPDAEQIVAVAEQDSEQNRELARELDRDRQSEKKQSPEKKTDSKAELPGGGADAPATGMAAILLDSEDAIWEGADSRIAYGRSFSPGRKLVLKSGLARLAFSCGAGVTLEGPAVLELCSGWQACLHRGKLAAIVPQGAEGFTVLTPQKRIIDLGTKFGAAVDETGQASVQVFEGEVKVESREATAVADSFLMTPASLPRYSESSTHSSEICVRGVDSSESVSVPTLEQLMAARTGVYPPRPAGRSAPNSEAAAEQVRMSSRESSIPSHVILGEDFSPLANLRTEAGSQNSVLKFNKEFALDVYRETPLRWQETDGGHFLLEFAGRDPAYPSIANRMYLRLAEPICEEVYFSFLARYDGLDETDFFGLWFDNNHRDDFSHSSTPNLGIRFGHYFARMHADQEPYHSHPQDGAVFQMVGRLLKNEDDQFCAIEMWLNPQAAEGYVPSPDLHAEFMEDKRKSLKKSFSVVGLRMGKDTEPTDRLLFDRLVIGRTFEEVTLPASLLTPPLDTPSDK